MNIIDIYNKYQIPVSLQNHMLKISAVAKLIIDNWHGPKLDEEGIIRVLLLKDLEKNINIENHPLEDKSKLIASALLDDEHIELMYQTQFINNETTMNSNDFSTKICAYASQRVVEDKIYSLYTSLAKTKDIRDLQTNQLIQYARIIEKQVLKYTLLEPDDINEETIDIAKMRKRII